MSEIRSIIIDDEPIAADIIESYLAKIKGHKLLARFSNAIDALDYLKEEKIDLIFLDIEMPELNGIQFLEIRPKNTQVILTTAHREFALDGFEHSVLDYLLKPISFERFYKALEKFKKTNELKKDYIFLKIENEMKKLLFNSISYIEGFGNYVKVKTNLELHIVYTTLSELEAQLAANGFIRCHKSFIISLNHVKSYSRKSILLEDKEIPIGQSFKSEILERLNKL